MVRIGRFLVCALGLSACTLASGASDYKVDVELERQLREREQLKKVRDLSYSFEAFVAHAQTALDAAIVDADNVLQARARIILPPAPMGAYPTEVLSLRNGLTPGAQTNYFYVDSNGDNQIDGSAAKVVEHIWIKPIAASGTDVFVHSTQFQFFSDDDFTTLNGDLVLELPKIGTLTDEEVIECLQRKLDARVKETVEVIVTLVAEERDVGYFKTYRTNPLPREVRLRGMIDGGNEYRVEVRIDGAAGKFITKTAPANGDLVVPPGEWFPVALAGTLDCRN